MQHTQHLQPAAVHNLVVNSELTPVIIDDKDPHTATTIVEAVGQTAEKLALVKDGQTLLDIAGLSHGDDATVIADVKNAVLLEDRTEHVLHDNRRARVADEAGLLMELLAEEVDAEVAVLAGLRGGGDADNLARTALQDEQVADPDVVAGDGDGVGRHGAVGRVAGGLAFGLVAGSWLTGVGLADGDVFLYTLGAVLVV
ncbi:hypothetical protein LTR95_015211, partial [Oleoguttula sp. CCFEE 5521]